LAIDQRAGAFDVVVIGAGAAGMMCAAQAGQRGRRVALIDHVATIGEKIRISGGGRCNFTNVDASPSRYLSSDPGFAGEALDAVEAVMAGRGTRPEPVDRCDEKRTAGTAKNNRSPSLRIYTCTAPYRRAAVLKTSLESRVPT